MESRDYKIRFGVMIDGFTVQRWQLETLKLLTDNGIELAVIICNSENQTPETSFFEKIRHYPYRKLLFRLWNRYMFKPKKSEYFADPFVITTKKDTYLFFEWYSNKKGKSDLTVAKKSEDFEKYHVISDFPEHRSYPFVFENENTTYCIPEAYKTGKVSLYEFDKDRLCLQHRCNLIENQSLTNQTLYHKDGKWFLFATPQENSRTHLITIYGRRHFRAIQGAPRQPGRGLFALGTVSSGN